MDFLNGNSATPRSSMSESVTYELFLLDEDGEEVNPEDLESWRIKCLALATTLTYGYIWNNEGFNLCLGKSDGLRCLRGETDFGDFIEDEWFIVWILYQLTRMYPDIVCRVRDADGEFLLIEAASYLPKWLDIDTSKNRVFIHSGHLHIVSQPRTPGEIEKLPIGQPTLKSSLNAVRYHPKLTVARKDIEKSIHKRIEGFPKNAKEFVQKVNVFIPELIVKILDQDPNLVSPAVRAFYYRDPIDLRACRVFKHFEPSTRVWTQISMNRCSYAQLMQQTFKADKQSGYVLQKGVGADFKGMDLGCKLAHGFEILCTNCERKQSNNDETTFDKTAFSKYVNALENRDYFCGEVEGSKRHKELLSNARAYFLKFSSESPNNDDSVSVTAGKRILDAKLKILSENPRPKNLFTFNQRSDLPEESKDDWMYLNDEKMDDMLSEMKKGFQNLGKRKVKNENGEEAELNDLCTKMNNFVTKFSSYEGVDVPNDETVSFDAAGVEAALKNLSRSYDQGEDSLSDDFLPSEEESDGDSPDRIVLDAMQQMDDELASTNIGKSFIKEDNINGNNDSFEPVDIDLNLVQNFLTSCESEMDSPGAATMLLQSIGLKVESDRK